MGTYSQERSNLIPLALKRLKEETGVTEGNIARENSARFLEIMDELARDNWLMHRKETFSAQMKSIFTGFFAGQNLLPTISGSITVHFADGKAQGYEFRNKLT